MTKMLDTIRVYMQTACADERAVTPNLDYLRQHWPGAAGGIKPALDLVTQPETADIILLVDEVLGTDHFYRRVRKDPVVRRFREKVFLFTTHDNVIPFFPGIYASLPLSQADFSRQCAGFYLSPEFKASMEYAGELDGQCDLLFSYVGRNDFKPQRDWLLALRHERGFVRDTWCGRGDLPGKHGFLSEEPHVLYAAATRRSAFVLCPRGYGVSSLRLFETMMMGRVPVILADDWTPPQGVDWDAISVRAKEGGASDLVQTLEKLLPHAKEMGRSARKVWLENFTGIAAIERIVKDCLTLRSVRTTPEKWARFRALRHQLQPYHIKRWIATNSPEWTFHHNESR